ncbi:PREDICTED: myosin-17 [Camelina sativa]|uniref:Myosin-17 n=1 Tax=Camelina sativa TaxID=90675 RepID=A0ABM1REE9_CAMSA|nr:PREDICTED: myosin-17 [Camelina sativa]
MSQDMDPFTEAIATSVQEALNAMWLRVEEANADVIREWEAERKAIEEAPRVSNDTPVLVEYTERIKSLSLEVEVLKASLQSERQAAQDLRKAFSQAEAKNSELATKLENVTRRVDQLCDSENQEVLAKSISQNLGYEGGKPVAAYIIYKCLLHWRSFEVERTIIFKRIVQIITSAIQVIKMIFVPDDNNVLAYWLSNSATLFCLLKRTFTSATITPSSRVKKLQILSLSFFVFCICLNVPASGFKQQLIDFIEKVYAMIRDNLKKEIFPLFEFCKQGRFANARTQVSHWESIGASLSSYQDIMKANNVSLWIH